MTLSKERLEELERVAKAATPGPWELTYRGFVEIPNSDCQVSTEHSHGTKSWTSVVATPAHGHQINEGQDAFKNMKFISALNPRTVLELITAIKKLREGLEDCAHPDEPFPYSIANKILAKVFGKEK